MAISQDEQQSIINAVLSSIRTNSRTIEQLTLVTSLNDNDSFEVGGGKRVTYGVLRDLIASLSSTEQDSLRTLINKSELKAVAIDVTETTATLSVSSVGKTISASIPMATENVAGMMSAMDKVRLQSAYSNANAATDKAADAQRKATEAIEEAADAKRRIDNVTGTIGQNGGIAPLNANGKVPEDNIPAKFDDVVDFHSLQENIAVQMLDNPCGSTDEGCIVVYNKETNTFVLAVLKNESEFGDESGPSMKHFDFYRGWADADRFGQIGIYGVVPIFDKLYRCREDNSVYGWNGEVLTMCGSNLVTGHLAGQAFPGNQGADLQKQVDGIEIYPFAGTVLGNPSDSLAATARYPEGSIVISLDRGLFYYRNSNGWHIHADYHKPVYDSDGVVTGSEPKRDVIYRKGNQLYRLDKDASGIYEMTAYAVGDSMLNSLRNHVDGIAIYPADAIIEGGEPVRITDITIQHDNSGYYWADVPDGNKYGFDDRLYNDEYTDAEGNIHLVLKSNIIIRCGNELYRYDGKRLAKIGGASVGNTLNLTAEYGLTDNCYYQLNERTANYYAPEVVIREGKQSLGLQITFAIAKGSWKTYQYVGTSLEPEDVRNKSNWLDLAGMSAGSEPVLNVNAICGPGILAQGAYTLASAIQAILQKEKETGISYQKEGMVLTYKVGDGAWESKQLSQSVASFNNPDAWVDFGGTKGAEIKTSDKPAKGGTDAFSTGGAFARIPAKHTVKQEDGKVTIQIFNEGNEEIMDPIEFLAAQNGGGQTGGTIVQVAFKDTPLRGALGAALNTKVAIRSVTSVGSTESENSIEKFDIIDTASNSVVFTQNLQKPSSPSLTTYDFDVDFTQFFTVAGQKKFKLVATDDTGTTGSKSITVIAEDLTLRCTQQLGQTIDVNDTHAYVDMYAFDNNQSEGGIRAKVDILIDGEWTNVQTEVVGNSFSRPVLFNAVKLGLSHGAYPIRMQGESVDSGVKGNIVYSTIMCVDPGCADTLIALRYDDKTGGKVRLFDTVSFDVAAYRVQDGARTNALVDVYMNSQKITQVNVPAESTVNVRKQLSGYPQGQKLTVFGRFGSASSPSVDLVVEGSALDISMKAGEAVHLDFASRSNSESDKTITDHGYTMNVKGANWRTNGFVEHLGLGALKIAENVTAHLNYLPFAHSTIENTGAAVQFKIATANIRDKEARLISCYDPESGAGFYVCGNKAAIFCKNGVTGADKPMEERKFECGEMHTIAVVVEPQSIYQERAGTRYSMLKLYIDGEESASIGYVPGQGAILSPMNVTFDGRDGDLYLYYFLAYQSHYEWAQAFDNYLVKGHDTTAMVEEYNAENVLVSQTVDGVTAMRPSHTALWSRGIRYMINIAPQETFDIFDHGNGSDDNGLTTTPKFTGIEIRHYDPVHPWRSFRAVNVTLKRQGTTSSTRPEKNEDHDYSKATITPLFAEYATDAELRAGLSAADLKDIADTFALFKIGYIRIGRNSMPIKRAMNKIDFSDSSCANNGGVCDMMNDTFRALGDKYLTPAQKFFDGTWENKGVKLEGLQINHSIENFPCAIFRSTSESLQNVYFHARGSYMESKKEQAALGFRDVSGYNKGCLNYGDFKELFTAPGQTIEQYLATADKSTWEYPKDFTKALSESNPAFNVIVISEYCGRNFKVFRRDAAGAEWRETTGSMRQVGGKWVITGDVMNPVTGVELLSYTGMCWWQGVETVEDMMRPQSAKSSWVSKLVDKGWVSGDTFPAWTAYFECLIEDDQLAVDYASGKKVPYELFNTLRFFNSVDPTKHTEVEWKERWKGEAWKYLSIESVDAYHIFTDYLAAVDQRAKNMQPMWFLEDGCSINNGVYHGTDDGMEPMRMYLNKVYDCDTCNGKDNEGGETIDPETDPDKPTNEDEGYKNPYAGWGSILFNCIAGCKRELVVTGHEDDQHKKPTISLMTVASSMRSAQITRADGKRLTPFSPDGARYYFIEQRIMKWPKKVTTYDCERKYISHTATANKIYFYANQGSGRTSLGRFITQRWLVRDGFYQTGGFFANPMTIRINCRPDAKIPFTAGARGYFAVGYENVGQITESVFLEKGESHEFSEFSKVDGTSLYLYQTQRMAMLNLSQLTINGADFTKCELMEVLKIGSEDYVEKPMGSYSTQTALPLGNLPFLHTVDVTNTPVVNIDAEGCPRLAHVNALGSKLEKLTIAKTSPINDINLPDTMSAIDIQYLPELTYTGIASLDGLRISAYAKVRNLRVENSPKVNTVSLLRNIVKTVDSALKFVRIEGQRLKGDATEMIALIDKGVQGMNESGEGNRPRPVVIGEYELTQLLEQADINRLQSNIEGLSITIVVEAFTDAMDVVNCDSYSGMSEVDTVTLENVGDHILYYNGETAEEYITRQLVSDLPVIEIINQ